MKVKKLLSNQEPGPQLLGAKGLNTNRGNSERKKPEWNNIIKKADKAPSTFQEKS